jgi:hypothetical protein
MGRHGSSESYATTNNNTKCEKNKHKTRSKTLPTRAQAFPQRALGETINRKARTETGRQASKQKAPAPRLQNCMNSQEIKIKIKTAKIKRFLRFYIDIKKFKKLMTRHISIDGSSM